MTTTAVAVAVAEAAEAAKGKRRTSERLKKRSRSTTFHLLVVVEVAALAVCFAITVFYTTTTVVDAAKRNRGFFPTATITAAHKFWRHRSNVNRNNLIDSEENDEGETRGAHAVHSLLRSIPAFSKIPRHKHNSSSNIGDASAAPPLASFFAWRTDEASVKTKKRPLPLPSELEQRSESELDNNDSAEDKSKDSNNKSNNDMSSSTPADPSGRQRGANFKRPSLPSFPTLPSFLSLPSLPSSIATSFPSIQVDPKFFMGITPETMLYKTSPYNNNNNHNNNNKSSNKSSSSKSSNKPKKKVKKLVDLREGMSEALEELRSMRHEMELMRRELAKLQQMQMGAGEHPSVLESPATLEPDPVERQRQQQEALAQRRREYESLAQQVEQWAEQILFPTNNNSNNSKQPEATITANDGWVEVECHKMLRSKFNPDGRIRAYVKWMKDSRGPADITRQSASSESAKFAPGDQEWPCVRLYATIDAPVDDVCLYLSQAERVDEYNTLLEGHRDLEEITPHSKICWGQTPQILFVKPRDFVTFCSHRWRRDGTQVIINQACDGHPDAPVNAHAIRGATFIGPHPSGDPNRTHIAMVAHASPGADVPSWACRAAIQSLAPLEPFRLFYRINRGVQQAREELRALQAAELVRSVAASGSSSNGSGATSPPSQRRPAGFAQMGFACFWPNGGGEMETEASTMGDDGNGNEKDVELPKP